MFEAFGHAKNAFITLTYDDDHLPAGGSLEIEAYQKFLKKLRKRIEPHKIRYYFCGEYGETSQRPHYHAAIFGLGPEDAETIDKSWGLGFSHVGELTHDSAQYIAGYVTKKMTSWDDPRLNGRHPEFAKMSQGIGKNAVSAIADSLTTPAGCDALARVGDVPHALMMEGKSIPLGRYLRGKLREKLHFPDKKTPIDALNAWKAEMQKLQKEHVATSAKTSFSKYLDKSTKFKRFLVDKNAQKVLQLETKAKIYTAPKDKI